MENRRKTKLTEEIKKQAAVDETNVSAQPDTTVDGAQKDQDLDTLLAQYDEGTKPVSQPETKVETPTDDPVSARIQALEQRYIQEDIKRASEEIFAGLEASDRMRKAFLDQLAREKPAMAAAFFNKERDPATWRRILPGIINEARKEFRSVEKIDPDATADRNAVAAAVRGASTKVTAEPPPNLGRMSNADFHNWTRENFGF